LIREKITEPSQIDLDLGWLDRVIGQKIKPVQVTQILTSLGFIIKEKNNILSVTVPSWRATRDITIPQDLVEEVARIYGYNNLKPSLPQVNMMAAKKIAEIEISRKIKNLLSSGQP
jgi:phenylalanyl-tRNA synthetase beta chain